MALFGSFGLLSGNGRASEIPKDPIYVVIDNGWMGLYAHKDEYAVFSFTGKGIKIEDAYHISLRQGLGMMVTFAERKEFGNGADLLTDHARWELNHWRSHADRVESVTRGDLSGTRQDLRITGIRLYRNSGERMTVYLIGLASKEGVFVLSISPGDQSTDPLVKEIARSFKLVPRTLGPDEVAKVARAVKNEAKPKAQ